mmetsp:Transcript_8271/g.11460  ORF Transcript_8271/g.11460 Transcript_8271/m.11460 type:complete len:105 (-) Transcript_8271:104-418(-)
MNQCELYSSHSSGELVPRALVGLKKDLAEKRTVAYEEALNLAASNKMSYHEVSSLTGEGVRECMNLFFEKSVQFLCRPIETESSLKSVKRNQKPIKPSSRTSLR